VIELTGLSLSIVLGLMFALGLLLGVELEAISREHLLERVRKRRDRHDGRDYHSKGGG
jgi:hypothetical protein